MDFYTNNTGKIIQTKIKEYLSFSEEEINNITNQKIKEIQKMKVENSSYLLLDMMESDSIMMELNLNLAISNFDIKRLNKEKQILEKNQKLKIEDYINIIKRNFLSILKVGIYPSLAILIFTQNFTSVFKTLLNIIIVTFLSAEITAIYMTSNKRKIKTKEKLNLLTNKIQKEEEKYQKYEKILEKFHHIYQEQEKKIQEFKSNNNEENPKIKPIIQYEENKNIPLTRKREK